MPDAPSVRRYTLTVDLLTRSDPDRTDSAVDSAVQWSTMREALMAALDGADVDADLLAMTVEPGVETPPYRDPDALALAAMISTEPGDPCRCGHPAASHDFTDGEPGPCWDAGKDADECWCDLFRADNGPDDDDLAAAGMIGEGGGGSYLAAWRESDEAHR